MCVMRETKHTLYIIRKHFLYDIALQELALMITCYFFLKLKNFLY